MKVFVYQFDRSEYGMTQPIIDRLKNKNWLLPQQWKYADIVLIPGDRREAMRFALDAFEAGKRIWHLGAGDVCEGDRYHYDGTYRKFISTLAIRSGGTLLGLGRHVKFQLDMHNLGDNIVGPTMIDDLPDTNVRPTKEPYSLLLYNPVPGDIERIGNVVHMLPPSVPQVYFAAPGQDGDCPMMSEFKLIGYKFLPTLPRRDFLCWLRHADSVWGNSSALCYEAPLWHKDEDIHFIGLRNKGRPIVRWDVKRYGSPSDNVINIIEKNTICQ